MRFVEEILNELKQNTKVKFKETDLFRFYQSIDLVRYDLLLNAPIEIFDKLLSYDSNLHSTG